VDRSLIASVLLLFSLCVQPVFGAPPLQTTVCAVMEKPSAFSGKLVQVQGTITAGFENFSLSEGTCGAIWVDLPDDQYVHPRPKFKLLRDAKFVEFERLIKAKSSAKVVLVGRLDGVGRIEEKTYARNQKHEDGTNSGVVGSTSTGFGHMGQYRARLVLKQLLAVGPTASSQP
jgi:hypothetical protein